MTCGGRITEEPVEASAKLELELSQSTWSFKSKKPVREFLTLYLVDRWQMMLDFRGKMNFNWLNVIKVYL